MSKNKGLGLVSALAVGAGVAAVAAGKKYKTTSLNNFREKYRNRIGESYIIHPRNLIIKDGIICIPPYMTMML